MFIMLQGKIYILLSLSTIKTKIEMVPKERTGHKTFQFRNDLNWTGLGENYFLCAKAFLGNNH